MNSVVLWTTRYIDAAVAQLRAEGHEIRDEDIARLSPAAKPTRPGSGRIRKVLPRLGRGGG